MKKILKALAAAALVLSLPGCVGERLEPDPGGDTVSVNVSTRAAIGDVINELPIASVRIIVIDPATGRAVFNEWRTSSVDDLDQEEVTGEASEIGDFIAPVLPGTYDFHVVMNETSAMGLAGVRNLAALEAVRITAAEFASGGETMVCYGVRKGVNVPLSDPPPTVKIEAKRAGTKLTVKVGKKTTDPDDRFTITGATLSGIPTYGQLMPDRIYTDTEFGDATLTTIAGSLTFTTNVTDGDDHVKVAESLYLPEYLMADPVDGNSALNLALTTDYTSGDGAAFAGIEYNITIPGIDPDDGYSLMRGNHYVVSVEIEGIEGFNYHVSYNVALWETIDSGGTAIDDEVITTRHEWAAGTPPFEDSEGKTLPVNHNGKLVYLFTLANPAAEWTAHLTNTVDFEFDLIEGVSSGATLEGVENLIVIRPLREVSESVTTEFYITVRDAVKETEISLRENAPPGPGNRYVIRQIPTL